MKRIINYILAALFLAAAMSLNTSCQKDDDVYVARYLYLDSAPENFGDGSACELTVLFRTNFPEGSITVTSSADWIKASITGTGKVTLTVARNESNTPRDAQITISAPENHVSPLVISGQQDYFLIDKEGMVPFRDKLFKNAVVVFADTDGDNEVSFEEALDVKEMNIVGKGIKDLAGLEYFKNVWKFDAQNNNIEDATVLKELPLLYWVDLKGNMNLKTFDLTGCSVYFEHRDFEMTEDLHYFMTRQQIQKYEDLTDRRCTKSKHVIDPRESTDYSRQGELTLIKEHTVGDGYPLVFMVWGAIDVDVNDGTYERLVKDAMDLELELNPVVSKYKDYFDVYMLIHIRPNRNEYRLGYETTDQETKEAMAWVKEKQTAIYDETYDRLVPEGSGICKMLMQILCLNTASRTWTSYNTSVKSWNTMFPGSDKGIYNIWNINRWTGDEGEESYSLANKNSLKEMAVFVMQDGYYQGTPDVPGWPYGAGEYFDVFMLGTKHYDRP